MSPSEIRNVVLAALRRVAPEANLDELSGDDDLRDALDIDSMDFNNFMLALHASLGVEVAERDYPRFFTLKGCLAELEGRLAGKR